jgi:hypothetical protein
MNGLLQSIEQGNRANARAQAIEIDRLRDENARLREALREITIEAEGLLIGKGMTSEFIVRNRSFITAHAALKGE